MTCGATTAPGMTAPYPSPNSSFSEQYEKKISGSHLSSPDIKFQSLITLPEYKLCLSDGILDSVINSSFAKMTHF